MSKYNSWLEVPAADVERRPMTEYLTTEQVGEYLQVPVNTIYKWRVQGDGPRAARIGRHLRWSLEEVDRWVAERSN